MTRWGTRRRELLRDALGPGTTYRTLPRPDEAVIYEHVDWGAKRLKIDVAALEAAREEEIVRVGTMCRPQLEALSPGAGFDVRYLRGGFLSPRPANGSPVR
ncbi:MAG: hypothetical protein HOP28_12255 [Gemmatimonadales bacterium]|nr:hypothetical protein [Gemmatimonadales bacterium]